jgi:haloacetate dehalogenase
MASNKSAQAAAHDFDDFVRERVPVAAGSVAVRRAGRGPAVLLLHGYPETSLAWRQVAPALTRDFTVVVADLPGYGDSTVSDTAFDEGRLSKRTMADALVEAMRALQCEEFAVVGHDRGARVAYRLALDHPRRVRALAVLDVLPILDMAERMTYDAARLMGHWFWLGQPSTGPETLIGRDPDLYVRHIIEQWDGAGVVAPDAVDDYVRCMRKPEVLRAIGAEYRADLVDLDHDRADRAAARKISCPLLAVWATPGLAERFGDPLAIWGGWADRVEGGPIRGGHFLMEECPQEITASVASFLTRSIGSSPGTHRGAAHGR